MKSLSCIATHKGKFICTAGHLRLPELLVDLMVEMVF